MKSPYEMTEEDKAKSEEMRRKYTEWLESLTPEARQTHEKIAEGLRALVGLAFVGFAAMITDAMHPPRKRKPKAEIEATQEEEATNP